MLPSMDFFSCYIPFWNPNCKTKQKISRSDTVDGRNPAPFEVGSLSHYLQGFFTSQVVVCDFFHQQYVLFVSH